MSIVKKPKMFCSTLSKKDKPINSAYTDKLQELVHIDKSLYLKYMQLNEFLEQLNDLIQNTTETYHQITQSLKLKKI